MASPRRFLRFGSALSRNLARRKCVFGSTRVEDGRTCIEYDRPSSLFGQFGDERVSPMAASLDQKLEDLAAAATR